MDTRARDLPTPPWAGRRHGPIHPALYSRLGYNGLAVDTRIRSESDEIIDT